VWTAEPTSLTLAVTAVTVILIPQPSRVLLLEPKRGLEAMPALPAREAQSLYLRLALELQESLQPMVEPAELLPMVAFKVRAVALVRKAAGVVKVQLTGALPVRLVQQELVAQSLSPPAILSPAQTSVPRGLPILALPAMVESGAWHLAAHPETVVQAVPVEQAERAER
jgi:hypothetical protein